MTETQKVPQQTQLALIASLPDGLSPEEVLDRVHAGGFPDATAASVDQQLYVVRKRRGQGLPIDLRGARYDTVCRRMAYLEPFVERGAQWPEVEAAARKDGVTLQRFMLERARAAKRNGQLAALAEHGRSLPPGDFSNPSPKRSPKDDAGKENYAKLCALCARSDLPDSDSVIAAAKELGLPAPSRQKISNIRHRVKKQKSPATLKAVALGRRLLAKESKTITRAAPLAVKAPVVVPTASVVKRTVQVDGVGMVTENEQMMLRLAYEIGLPRSSTLLQALQTHLSAAFNQLVGR
jgi:hypothetical protein